MDIDFSNMWCWLLPLLCTLLGALFGYFLGKSGSKTIDTSADLKLWKDKNVKLQSELDACNAKLTVAGTAATAGTVAAVSSLTARPLTTENSFNAAEASAVFGKTIKEDDLKVVEGIGPKISEMFKEDGIKTWKALSETSVADCQKVLAKGGNRYKVHDPASWPMQAKMCYENKWADLFKWQDEHNHGKL